MTICYPDTIIWPERATTVIDELTNAEKERVQMLAWTTFQALTGYSLAICPIEARPCRRSEAEPVYQSYPVGGSMPFHPAMRDGGWVNCGCGSDPCGGCGVSWVTLPGYIGGIDSVTIGNTVLPRTAYRVDNGSRLVRQDGEAWPSQDLSLPAGSDGTWTVRYFQGDGPTEMDAWAVGILALEFVKAMKDDKKCRLPAGVTTVVRSGVTIELTRNLFIDGTTGIREVDALIAQRNPNRLTQPPRVLSPDLKRGVVTTWSR